MGVTDEEPIHIGRQIRARLKADGRSVVWFADRICCTRAHAYKIFAKPDIDTELLRRISVVLDYDFFEYVSRNLEGIKRK